MPPTRTVIKIRADELEKYRSLTHLTTAVALAAKMGVSVDTVRRTLGSETSLSASFIAALLAAFPGLKFDDLFAVERESVAA